jgi:hypothetical protein
MEIHVEYCAVWLGLSFTLKNNQNQIFKDIYIVFIFIVLSEGSSVKGGRGKERILKGKEDKSLLHIYT